MPVLPLPSYTPVFPVTKTVKPRQRVAKLPNWGIEQRETQGQNQTAPEWNVQWVLTPAEANDLDAFLAARAKTGEWFLWVPPGESGSEGKVFRCDTWTKQLTACSIYEVQATFRQVFDIRQDALVTGLVLSIPISLSAGAASGGTDATATGFALSVTASLVAGIGQGDLDGTASGFDLVVTVSFVGGEGQVGVVVDGTASGLALTVTASLVAGSAEGFNEFSVSPVTFGETPVTAENIVLVVYDLDTVNDTATLTVTISNIALGL